MKPKFAILLPLFVLILTGCGGLSDEEIRATIQSDIETEAYISGLETDAARVAADTAAPTEIPVDPTTPEADVAQVSVSEDTNCRTGPAVYYDYVSTLATGVAGKWLVCRPILALVSMYS